MQAMEFYVEQIKNFKDMSFEDRREAVLELDELKIGIVLGVVHDLCDAKGFFLRQWGKGLSCGELNGCRPVAPTAGVIHYPKTYAIEATNAYCDSWNRDLAFKDH